MPTVYYNDYLNISKLKECNVRLTNKHDEHLFIITHQAYELWFSQILFELSKIIPKLNKPFKDNGPEVFIINHRLNRIVEIWKVLVQQFTILETMTPLDFLDFRSELGRASGFQSVQFKEIEATLGLKSATRYHPPDKKNEETGELESGKDYYKVIGKEKGGFDDIHNAEIEKRENSPTLLDAVKNWLGRMPFFEKNTLWAKYKMNETAWNNYEMEGASRETRIDHPFWKDYFLAYYNSLSPKDKEDKKENELIEVLTKGNSSYTAAEVKSALFIMSYRAFPIFHLPFQLLTNVIEIDEQLSDWRYRHLNVVSRIIGSRSGTKGGVASGSEYLKGIVEKNYIFKELSSLVSYLIPRKDLPKLPNEVKNIISYGS